MGAASRPDAGGAAVRTRQRRGAGLPRPARPRSTMSSTPTAIRSTAPSRVVGGLKRSEAIDVPPAVSRARACRGRDRRRRRSRVDRPAARRAACRLGRTCRSSYRRFPRPARADRPGYSCSTGPGAAQAVVRVGHVGIARSDPISSRCMLVNQILGGQFTSRLNEKLREERGFTYGVRSHFDCRRGRGPFSITTSLQSDRLAEALDDIHHELLALVGGRPPSRPSSTTPAGP